MQLYREEENNMKKRILTAVLAAALVTGTCAATVRAKEEKTYTIGICPVKKMINLCTGKRQIHILL